jgi:hypothetical protein
MYTSENELDGDSHDNEGAEGRILRRIQIEGEDEEY